MSKNKDTRYEVEHTVTDTDAARDPEDLDAGESRQEPAPGFSAYRDEDSEREGTPRDPYSQDDPRQAEDGRELTGEEAELAKPVAAVPASVNLDDIEPADGFRLPRDQPEAEDARLMAEREAQDARRPEVAQGLADKAQEHADKAAEHARLAQEYADKVKDAYQGADRPPLHEGWRYKKPEPDVHDPV
jgi:hypothetical protein